MNNVLQAMTICWLIVPITPSETLPTATLQVKKFRGEALFYILARIPVFNIHPLLKTVLIVIKYGKYEMVQNTLLARQFAAEHSVTTVPSYSHFLKVLMGRIFLHQKYVIGNWLIIPPGKIHLIL